MAWITCATCGQQRGGINAAIYREPNGQLTYAQPACWNCDAPGWDMPTDHDPEQTQPLGTKADHQDHDQLPSSEVAKRQVADHQPKSDPVFSAARRRRTPSAVRKSLFSEAERVALVGAMRRVIEDARARHRDGAR